MNSTSNTSPKAPFCLLLETGVLEDHGSEAPRLLPDEPLILSRALCRFRSFRAPPGLSRAEHAAAARLYAESHAPDANSDWLILRTEHGAAIWYWDKTVIAAVVGDQGSRPTRIAPESLFHPPGEGWRILRVAEGHEAQCWLEGALVASMWRREAFTDSSWAAFVLSVESDVSPPPPEPPEPVWLAMNPSWAWARQRIGAPWGWREVERLAWAGAAVAGLACVGIFTFAAADTVRYAHETARVQQLESRAKNDPGRAGVHADASLIAQFRAAQASQEILTRAADALHAIEQSGFEIESWTVDQHSFSATVRPTAESRSIGEAALKMQSASKMRDVTPVFLGRDTSGRPGAIVLKAQLAGSAPSATPNAGSTEVPAP